jgi:hypothetical protein
LDSVGRVIEQMLMKDIHIKTSLQEFLYTTMRQFPVAIICEVKKSFHVMSIKMKKRIQVLFHAKSPPPPSSPLLFCPACGAESNVYMVRQAIARKYILRTNHFFFFLALSVLSLITILLQYLYSFSFYQYPKTPKATLCSFTLTLFALTVFF